MPLSVLGLSSHRSPTFCHVTVPSQTRSSRSHVLFPLFPYDMGYVHGSREGTLQKNHFDNMLVTYCFIVVILIVCMFVFRGMCMNAGTFEGHKLLLPPGIGVRDGCKLSSVGARYQMSPLQEQNTLGH